ncbi:MAG: RsmE family RNA methyltransferase [bacterium]|nr:RsmE family RNA methyltransferase [bacterium]
MVVRLPKELQHQAQDVLRFKAGENIVLFDGSGYDFISEFSGKDSARIVEKALNRREPERKIFLFQSLLKKDKMEWVFEKGTEVGAAGFFPVLSARSIKTDFNKVRAGKIIKEAAEQSGRALLPEIREVLEFKKALEFVQKERLAGVIADPNSKKHISETLKEPKMALFVGPEGGFTEEEISEAKECGFKAVSLGKLNLRSETAAIVGAYTLLW